MRPKNQLPTFALSRQARLQRYLEVQRRKAQRQARKNAKRVRPPPPAPVETLESICATVGLRLSCPSSLDPAVWAEHAIAFAVCVDKPGLIEPGNRSQWGRTGHWR